MKQWKSLLIKYGLFAGGIYAFSLWNSDGSHNQLGVWLGAIIVIMAITHEFEGEEDRIYEARFSENIPPDPSETNVLLWCIRNGIQRAVSLLVVIAALLVYMVVKNLS